MVAEYCDVAQARELSGMRIVTAPGVPGPWAEALKGICYVKNISYACVRFDIGGDLTALREWTAQESAPVAIWNDERPRSNWIDQLYLAERIEPVPTLIPAEIEERTLMFGYANELCGENGFGWSRRLLILHPVLANPDASESDRAFARYLGDKYGYTSETGAGAAARVVAVLSALSARLERQHAIGSRYFINDQLSALDIYWAAFAALIEPLPPELCPMGDNFRTMYTNTDPVVQSAVTTSLMEHRDFIYREHLALPVAL